MSRPAFSLRVPAFILISTVLVGLLLAGCEPLPAPTPDVEQLAQALVKTWATQTAQAAASVAVTATLTATPTPAATEPPTPVASSTSTRKPRPRPSPTPGCVAVDANLSAMWDWSALGCPTTSARIIAAGWQQLERGYLFWRSDEDRTYALGFDNGSDLWQGPVLSADPAWHWGGSYPNGHGLVPPAGLFEPVGRFGVLWLDRMGGPAGPLGWAVAPSQELCIVVQTSAAGLVARTYGGACGGVQHQSFEPLYLSLPDRGTWRRLPVGPLPTPRPTATPTATPITLATVTPSATPITLATATPTATPITLATATPTATSITPGCPIATDMRLAPAWDRGELGCPTSAATVIWAAWEPFEKGEMLWRSDNDWSYQLGYAGGDTTRGSWATGGNAWRWDGSFPDGHGLTPPAGRYEPVRGFGFAWYNYLGGPSGQLGWAIQPERGICITLQSFASGLIFASNAEVEYCLDTMQNRARDAGFSPIRIVLRGDGAWRRR